MQKRVGFCSESNVLVNRAMINMHNGNRLGQLVECGHSNYELRYTIIQTGNRHIFEGGTYQPEISDLNNNSNFSISDLFYNLNKGW